PLQLLHDEPVGHVVEARAAVALEGGPEDPHLAEILRELHRERAVPVVLAHDGKELRLHPVADRVPHHALLFGQEIVNGVVVHAAKLFHDACPSTWSRGWWGG